MNITSSIDLRDINPYPWWDQRSPFHVGDVPNPSIHVGDAPRLGWNDKLPEGYKWGGPMGYADSTHYIQILLPDPVPPPSYELSTNGGKNITYYDLSGKNITPKEKSVITKDALAIYLVPEAHHIPEGEIKGKLLGIADSVQAVRHFVGLRYEMDDETAMRLSDLLYGNKYMEGVLWQLPTLEVLWFTRTVIATED